MELYELESDRMYYRRLRADDYERIAPILRSAETMQFFGRAFTYDEALDWLVDKLRRYREDGCGWLLALDKPTGAPAALTGLLYEQANGERLLTVNCIVRHELRQIGVGKECTAACLHRAFAHMQAQQVNAFIRPDDIAALHIAAACGMQPVGQIDRSVDGRMLPHLHCIVRNPQLQAE